MLKFKYMTLSMVYLILCVSDWFFSNIPIINAIDTGYFTKTDILMNLHSSVSGYNGILKLLVIYSFPVLFGVYYISDKESPYCVLRNSSRAVYKRKEIGKVILVSGLFSAIHELVNYGLVNRIFNLEILKEHNFAKYSVVTAVIFCMFFVQTGILYHIIADLCTNKIYALFGSFAWNFIQYLGIKYYIINFWIPGVDLMKTFEYLMGNINALLIMGRNILMVFIFYILCQMTFEKKDLIKYEE